MPLYNALHVNRWKQPELEQQAGGFLKKKYATLDPVRQYAAVRVWNEYLKTREGFPADKLLKMQEAFETFKKAALQKKKLVKEHKMQPQEFMDWLYRQSSVIMELVEDCQKL